MKGSKIDTTGLPHHRILGQILYELICRESSGDGVRIASLRRELANDDEIAGAYPHNLSKAISNSLRRLLWDGKIIREARGFYQVAPVSANQNGATSSSSGSSSIGHPAIANTGANLLPPPTTATKPMPTSLHGQGRQQLPLPYMSSAPHHLPIGGHLPPFGPLGAAPGPHGPIPYLHPMPPPPPPASSMYPHGSPYTPSPGAGYASSSKHRMSSRDDDSDDFAYSEDDPTPRKKAKMAMLPDVGVKLAPLKANPGAGIPYGHHNVPYSTHPSLNEPYGNGRHGFGTSWERSPHRSLDADNLPPLKLPSNGESRFRNASNGSGGNSNSNNGSAGGSGGSSTAHSNSNSYFYITNPGSSSSSNGQYPAPNPVTSREPFSSPRDSSLPSVQQVIYEIFTYLPESPVLGGSPPTHGPSSSSTPSYNSTAAARAAYSSFPPSANDGRISTGKDSKCSIANMLSGPASPRTTARQNFARKCPNLAKYVSEALQVLSSSEAPGVTTTLVRKYVLDRLVVGQSPIDSERRNQVNRATDWMLAGLVATGGAVEVGIDKNGESMYANK
ncbi:hypothetical protein OC846_000506 [Tilletia horrida]|uniref:Uncharacterized protein n=1 Tax=Tilletia horrida TaxID=155126 RepID=A0AAN6K0R7_9BASI|nr:hypothetical protein OC846_000506 [Tilletia horrida]KAK0561573.1 hypothetical protein OC861_005753 [Tilletia horrida]